MPTANYWVVMFDRDGGEKDPEGPFDSRDEAKSHAEFDLDGCRWVTYEIQEGDDYA
jgi:hypothetical protein